MAVLSCLILKEWPPGIQGGRTGGLHDTQHHCVT